MREVWFIIIHEMSFLSQAHFFACSESARQLLECCIRRFSLLRVSVLKCTILTGVARIGKVIRRKADPDP
jgi:hypothetical protein